LSVAASAVKSGHVFSQRARFGGAGMRKTGKTTLPAGGFTLIELLVVVGIIALLISILLPALRTARQQAQAAVCMSNQRQVLNGIAMYQMDLSGIVPGNLWSEDAWYVTKSGVWFYALCPKYVGDPDVLICPGDPFRSEFDFEAWIGPHWHENARVASCSYALNYVLRHFAEPYSFNIEAFPPTRPAYTILMTEVGPDDQIVYDGTYGAGLAAPWRDAGRMVWDDGARPWYINKPTWLTARHLGAINMAAMDLSVKRVPTLEILRQPILAEYGPGHALGDCKGGDCYFCNYHPHSDATHYNFSSALLWWWTGEYPRYPG
jgi:prepilin-type N-terminal cleavage/methylation domain-containing protein